MNEKQCPYCDGNGWVFTFENDIRFRSTCVTCMGFGYTTIPDQTNESPSLPNEGAFHD